MGGYTKPRINIFDASTQVGGGTPSNNDNFSNARSYSGGRVTSTNNSATKEPGEPNHAGNAGGKSVWYRWTPQASGTVLIQTAGSNFDTLLGIYTGSAVNSLSEVASNDDVAPPGNRTSSVTFSATAGVPYQIAVDGYNGAAGNLSVQAYKQQWYKVRVKKGKKKRWVWRYTWVPISASVTPTGSGSKRSGTT